ncbi:MAG: M20/M25/M40 family metallo-hydrolase [Gemmatimonadetes bacterium]|nr:M20/M25/M40 family metallo-hydrolase [Gemmatimonadota bacterium]
MRTLTVFLVVQALVAGAAQAQLRTEVQDYVSAHQQQILGELVSLLEIPNIAADRANIRRNAERLREMLARRGFAAEILETSVNPLVFGEMRVPGAQRTLLLYAHYDGQPVNPSGWRQDDPFRPILRDGRLEDGAREITNFLTLDRLPTQARVYARSASDDKSPIVALLAAVDALRSLGRQPTSNLKVILDGEEEAGSRGLVGSMDRYREKYSADVMLILDGPIHASGRPTLTFGARGIVSLDLTVHGAKSDLHSGHYGNWAPNPAMDLARLLASMKDESGRAVVAGFYDDVPPLTPEEKRILEDVPDDPQELMRFFGIARTDKVGASLQEALQYPSLNIRGLSSAYVGAGARTIIPSTATAAIDIRLVQETDPDRMAERVIAHIRGQGFHVIEGEPDDATRARYPRIVSVRRSGGTRAYRSEMTLRESRQLIQALERAWGQPPVRIRTSGGTVPIYPFIEALGFPAISVPVVNFDNNQHSENENLRLDNLWNAVVTFSAILAM